MRHRAHGLATAALVSLLGAGTLWWGTDGLAAFTTEGARRMEVLHSPRPLPAAVLEDQDGRAFQLQDYRGRLLAVEFIYTRCATVCRDLGRAFRRIRDRVPGQMLGSDFALVSISFDSRHDDPTALKHYGHAHGADSDHWRIARVRDPDELAALLEVFGVVAIPDGRGGFEHNAAIHLVGRAGRLVEIIDLDQTDALAERIARRS